MLAYVAMLFPSGRGAAILSCQCPISYKCAVKNNKNNKHLRSIDKAAATIIAVLALHGCGGDNVSVFGLDGPPSPDLSLQITADNANQVMAVHAAATESLMHLSALGVDLLVRTAESGMTAVTLPCASGTVSITLNDLDMDGLPSAEDTALIVANECEFADTGYTSDGSTEMLIRNFFARSNASSRAKFQYDLSVFMVSRGATAISFNGKLDADFIGNTTSQTLVATTRFPNSVFTRAETPAGIVTNNYFDVTISRDISTLDELTTNSAMSIESSEVGGAFACSANAAQVGPLGVLPDSGQWQCNGANASSARSTGSTGGTVTVSVDAEGDGTYEVVPLIPGGVGNWYDFFQTEFFEFVGRIAGDIPEEEPPVVRPTSAAFDVTDIVVSPDAATFYIANDAGLTRVDAATLAQIDQLALPDRPQVIDVSDDDSTVWLGFADAQEILPVDTATLTPGARVALGASASFPNRFAARIRVLPGDPETVVVAMANNGELVAYSGGAALPNIIDDVRAPQLFEFADAATIVGHNNVDAEYPAAVVAVSGTGLGPVTYLREFDVLPANEVVLGNANLFSTTGRVTNPQASSVEGKIKLDQVRTADNQDGIAIDKAEGVVYTFNASESLLESYYEATMVLRSAHEVPISGNFVRLLDAGDVVLLASDTTISIVDKDRLAPNRNLSPCETTDLSGVRTPGFVAQIDCAFNDVVFDRSRNVIYGSLPSFAGVNGNSVAIIDATTGMIVDRVFAGSEPGNLSMSADGNTLYVALRETTKVANVDLQAMAGLPPIQLELNKLNRKPVFALDVAVSPQSTSTLLMAAQQEIAIYENGSRLPDVVSFYGPIRDALFDQDGSTAFVQKSGGAGDVLGILDADAMGVALVDEDNTTLRAGSLKLEDGKLYDRFGVVADSTTLNVLGNCDASSPFGTRLVEPSESSNDIYYVDRASDSVLTVCSEATFTNSKQVQVPLAGSLNSPPLALEEAGSNRLIMTSSDKLIIFQVDTLE